MTARLMNAKRRQVGLAALVVGCSLFAAVGAAAAQQATITTPMRNLNDGFFENIGTNWSLRGNNWFLNVGGGGAALPPFGGFNPGAGIQGGFGFGGNGINGGFNFSAGQGSSRSNVVQAPMVTVPNGIGGFVGDATLTPFVIGIVPVVGAGGGLPWKEQLEGRVPAPRGRRLRAAPEPRARPRATRPAAPADPSPRDPRERFASQLQAARNDASGVPLQSLSALRGAARSLEAREDPEPQRYLRRGQDAEAEGKLGVARIYYQNAARQGTGDVRQAALQRLRALSSVR